MVVNISGIIKGQHVISYRACCHEVSKEDEAADQFFHKILPTNCHHEGVEKETGFKVVISVAFLTFCGSDG